MVRPGRAGCRGHPSRGNPEGRRVRSRWPATPDAALRPAARAAGPDARGPRGRSASSRRSWRPFWTEVLWFDSVGFTGVFVTAADHQGRAVRRAASCSPRPRWRRASSSPTAPGRSTPRSRRSSRTSTSTARRSSRCAGSPCSAIPGVLGLLAGTGAAGQWKTFLLWRNRAPFGSTDPQFGLDCRSSSSPCRGCSSSLGFLTMVLVMALVAAAFTHYVYGGLQIQARAERTTRAARAAPRDPRRGARPGPGGDLLVRPLLAGDQGRPTLLTGIRYTDANAVLPDQGDPRGRRAHDAPALFIASIWTRSWRLPIVGVALLLVTSIVVGGIYPALDPALRVKPSREVAARRRTSTATSRRPARPTASRTSTSESLHGDDRGEPGPAARRRRRRSPASAWSTPSSSRRRSSSCSRSSPTTRSPTPSTSTATPSTARSATPSSRCASSTSTACRPTSATGSTTTPSTPTATASSRPTATSAPPTASRSSSSGTSPSPAARRVRAADLLRRAVAGLLHRRGRPRAPRRASSTTPTAARPARRTRTYAGKGGVADRLAAAQAGLRPQVPRAQLPAVRRGQRPSRILDHRDAARAGPAGRAVADPRRQPLPRGRRRPGAVDRRRLHDDGRLPVLAADRDRQRDLRLGHRATRSAVHGHRQPARSTTSATRSRPPSTPTTAR